MHKNGLVLSGSFGYLTIIREDGRTADSKVKWLCRCRCGKTTSVSGAKLRSGHTRSCGCRIDEVRGKAQITHGLSHLAEYRIWSQIKTRCYNRKYHLYKNYGGRGICMSEVWRQSFAAFYADVGARPTAHHTIERIDNTAGYVPGNVRWATRVEQNDNRRNTVHMRLGNRIMCARAWARELHIPYQTLLARKQRYGWTDEQSLLTPVR